MVITRSHINEQISKGGNKMVTRPRRNLADIGKREYELKQQRKRAKKAKARKAAEAHLVGGKKAETPKTKEIPAILVGKPKPKKIPKKIKGTQSTVAEREPTPRKKKKVVVQKMTFGGQEIKVPGRKYVKGGDVVMQKVRKYKEGGTVVHDQSTIKNL